ncbi:hypothetical protein M8C21_016099 [Ambrosia artemisiifolia]|uniref:Glycosyl transferase family 1 domain-containing protein n=1 Tax=Ambrosia artemisiifolia TaxID=4212 RepID=A0AAD5C6W0_AMBAR|nr:hypothetical protein M8C21_016099 [Ambrosia artemisiifolia]
MEEQYPTDVHRNSGIHSSRPVLKSTPSGKSRRVERTNGFNTNCFRSNRIVLWLLLMTLWAYAGFCIQSMWAHGGDKEEIVWGNDEIDKSFELSVSEINISRVLTFDDVKINANQSDVKKMDLAMETSSNRGMRHNTLFVKKRSKRSRRGSGSGFGSGSSSRAKRGNKKKLMHTEHSNGIEVQEEIPRTNATYGMLVGPFGSLEDRVVGLSPAKISGTCDRKSHFARLVWSKKFVLVFHELSMTGAPLSMMELASEILSCGGTVSVVALSRKGGLLPELTRKKIKVLEDKDKLSFKAAMKADLVIAGSAQWMGWCEEENIKFKSAPSLVPLSVNDELAFVAAISCSLNTPAFTVEKMLEKRLLLRKLVREEMGVKDSDMLVMALSSINPGKGHLLLLESVHLATNRKPGGMIDDNQDKKGSDIKLLIGSVGSKSNKVVYVKSLLGFLSNHTDLQNSVIWTPATTRVASLYSAADVYVINSQGIGETFGRVTIEAMANGIPVLGTDAGGTKEIVAHNVSGLLHPTGHSGTTVLSKHLQYLLNNPSERRRLGLEGREKVKKMYLKKHMYKIFWQVLFETMKAM